MRILIAGCGYVGLRLGTALVQAGHEVFGVTRTAVRKPELEKAGIRALSADITRLEDLNQIPRQYDWVVNCGASSGGTAGDYEALYLQGTRNLLDWLNAHPPRKFVYTSSTSVYGQVDGSVVDENSATEPQAGTAKILVQTENLLMDRAEEFRAVILRVAGIYCPGRRYWLKQFLDGKAALEGKGGRWLNMIHRDDLVRIIIAVLERGEAGEIYNAVDDEPVTQRDFFEWLSKQLGKPM